MWRGVHSVREPAQERVEGEDEAEACQRAALGDPAEDGKQRPRAAASTTNRDDDAVDALDDADEAWREGRPHSCDEEPLVGERERGAAPKSVNRSTGDLRSGRMEQMRAVVSKSATWLMGAQPETKPCCTRAAPTDMASLLAERMASEIIFTSAFFTQSGRVDRGARDMPGRPLLPQRPSG
ncbi:unnamed protein product [Prorocentrum cordatum]|uniref:Uncharacterized protein n=1 Tax=Prorocentrum cordatum TaxID=2364126 RepID=A0ABN9QL03_9DINO|nr:unnamed protein product [Polarella glacialis]